MLIRLEQEQIVLQLDLPQSGIFNFAAMHMDQISDTKTGILSKQSGFCMIHISLIRLMKSSKVWTLGRPKCKTFYIFEP